MHVYEVYMYTCECVCALRCSLTRHGYFYLDESIHFGGGMSFRLVFAMRNELSLSPFSVLRGYWVVWRKSLRCVSFVTTAWMECFVFILISERERESEEKVYCCARQILPCFARDYLCLSMCACIRSIHVYMRVRLCSAM